MLAFVLGTRPEIIKLAPILFEMQARGLPYEIIHTGQHYTPSLDEQFFHELGLPQPVVNLGVGSCSGPVQVGHMMIGLADVFQARRPSAVMVQGDTNTVLAGALSAFKLDIPVAHLEAGLRSDDWRMPEEGNRVLADRVSTWLFAPTELQKERLRHEGIPVDRIHVVGNSIVDAATRFSATTSALPVLERFGLTTKQFLLLTMHRPSNVDDHATLRAWVVALEQASRELGHPIAFPIHPRTQGQLERAGIVLSDRFVVLPPVGYLDMLALQRHTACILTDSGGIQEEACILRIPCVTLRENTERPETVRVGANVLCAPQEAHLLAKKITDMRSRSPDWENPFGDGATAKRVVDILVASGKV